jgi:hypothetical protein
MYRHLSKRVDKFGAVHIGYIAGIANPGKVLGKEVLWI